MKYLFDLHQDLPLYLNNFDGLGNLIGKYFPFEKEWQGRHADLPSLRKAKVKLIFASFFPLKPRIKLKKNFDFYSKESWLVKNKVELEKMVKSFNLFLERYPDFELVKNKSQLKNLSTSSKILLIYHLEGLYGVENTKDIDFLYNLGFRSFGLTWNLPNEICGTCLEKKGLTKKGKEIILNLLSKNVIVDLTHSSQKTFWDIVKINNNLSKIYYSHSALEEKDHFHPQTISREILEELKANGGILGLTLLPSIYKKISLNFLKKKIVELVNAGYADCLAFGTDYFGFSFNETPEDLKNITSFLTLYELIKKEISTEECDKIFYKNVLNWLMRNL